MNAEPENAGYFRVAAKNPDLYVSSKNDNTGGG